MRFIDLFSGIGGLRLGFEAFDLSCVFSAEKDRFACQTYKENFGEDPQCDITALPAEAVPDHDILLAGFPCQTFSFAGKRAGFLDTRGTLFFHVADILREKRPRAFLLENVRGLLTHDKRRTLGTILRILEEDLGYSVRYRILDAKDHGIPQKRPRIYIAGFSSAEAAEAFTFPNSVPLTLKVGDLLERNPVPLKYYISQRYLETLKSHRSKQAAKGNGFGYHVLDRSGVANTLVVGGMGRERNLIYDPISVCEGIDREQLERVNEDCLRVMTPRECARFMGFPEDFVIPVSDTQAYKQFGNSVCVPVIEAIAARMLSALEGEVSCGAQAG